METESRSFDQADGFGDDSGEPRVDGLVRIFSELSNCQKRRLVCVLYDASNRVVAIGYNSCTPPKGVCARLQIVQSKGAYTGTECNTTHAEINALQQVRQQDTAVRAEIYGHDFACKPCEKALNTAGVWDIKVIPQGFGTGLVKQ